MDVCLGPDHIVLDGNPASPIRDTAAPKFRPVSIVAKWLDGSKCHLVAEIGDRLATIDMGRKVGRVLCPF